MTRAATVNRCGDVIELHVVGGPLGGRSSNCRHHSKMSRFRRRAAAAGHCLRCSSRAVLLQISKPSPSIAVHQGTACTGNSDHYQERHQQLLWAGGRERLLIAPPLRRAPRTRSAALTGPYPPHCTYHVLHHTILWTVSGRLEYLGGCQQESSRLATPHRSTRYTGGGGGVAKRKGRTRPRDAPSPHMQ